ncbi:MAG: hypothetical protein ABSH38_06850 [Verrucomicrobiota bacterium]|jgi:hypothetical protein
MGLLNKDKAPKPELKRLPTGSFTVDAHGQVVSSTVPQTIPPALVRDIGQRIVAVFAGARKAQLPFSELVVQFASFKITAREMRGGAIIFLSPKALQWVSRS